MSQITNLLKNFKLTISTVAENIVRKQVLQKQSLPELNKSRITFVESSTKAGWLSLKALRKQDGFRWKLYESKIAFIESSSNAGWLSLKALWKPFKKCVNRNITKFRDKIAYVGGQSFRRRPWPFGERCSRARATSATLQDAVLRETDRCGCTR